MPGSQISDLLVTVEFTSDPCKPTLSIPSQVLTVNSLWSDCAPPVTAFYDPPYALSPGNGFATSALVTSSAVPAASPEIMAVSPTATISPTPAISATATVPSSKSVIEVQPVKVLMPADSSTPSLLNGSPDSVATSGKSIPASLPVSNNAAATVPVANAPLLSDPSGTDPSQNPPTSPSVAVLSFGSSVVTADKSSNLVFASQTLTPGGGLTVSGTYVSLASNGAYAVLGGKTTQLLATATPQAAVLSFGSSAVTADKSSNFVFASQTLTPGGGVTVSGTYLSLASNGGYVVLDGKTTQMLATPTQASAVEYIISSQTLRLNGPAITVAGTVMSLLSGASSVLVGTRTVAVGDLIGAATTTAPPGNAILSVGGFAATPNTDAVQGTGTGSGNYNGTMFLGGAPVANSPKSIWVLCLSIGVGVLGIIWL
jgi:hypothetical protein